MKYVNKLIAAASLAVAALGFSTAANALLITQDIVSDDLGTIATITVDVDEGYLGNGLLDSAFTPEAFNLVELSIIGLPRSFLDVFDIQFILDSDNVFAGLEYFYIDALDLYEDFGLGDSWVYQMEVDAFAPDFSFVDIFNFTSGGPVVFDLDGGVTFGNVSVVSEPSVLALFGLALAAFGLRRKVR